MCILSKHFNTREGSMFVPMTTCALSSKCITYIPPPVEVALCIDIMYLYRYHIHQVLCVSTHIRMQCMNVDHGKWQELTFCVSKKSIDWLSHCSEMSCICLLHIGLKFTLFTAFSVFEQTCVNN